MYSNATFVQSYIIIAVVLEIYRITLLSNTCVSGHSFDLVLEIYRITLLSNECIKIPIRCSMIHHFWRSICINHFRITKPLFKFFCLYLVFRFFHIYIWVVCLLDIFKLITYSNNKRITTSI